MTIPTEYEATLVICSEHPSRVIEELEQIEAIGVLRLDRRKSHSIRDVYFDTPARELSILHAALRIRRIGLEWRIALKGPTSTSREHVTARSELDLSWNQRTLERIEGELARYDLPVDWTELQLDDPVAALARSGFDAIQDRTVHRIVRDVVPEGTRVRACEMLIDTVTYRLNEREITHHEIEIEARNRENVSVANLLATYLVDRFGVTLRPWNYGKLATGRAVEELLKLDFLEHSVDDHGCLLPAAYDLILSYLRCSP